MDYTNFLNSTKAQPVLYNPNLVDINAMGRTFETLRKMADDAFKSRTALETAIAQAPLDESEEWYKQEILDTINNKMESLTDEFGLAGAAEKINKLMADIVNSKDFREKVDANKKHKAFVESVLNNKELSEIEKEYYLEKNPYIHKQGLKDSLGRDVMYDWDLDPERVRVIPMADMDKLLKQALSNVAARHYGDNHPIALPFNKGMLDIPGFKGQQFLPEDEIYVGMLDIINSDPKVKEGFKRKYEIGIWHDEKYKDDEWEMQTNKQVPTEAGTGLYIDYDTWVKGLLWPYATAAAYYTGYSPAQEKTIKTMNNPTSKGSTTTKVKLTDEQKQAKKIKETKEKNARNNNTSSSHSSNGTSRGNTLQNGKPNRKTAKH